MKPRAVLRRETKLIKLARFIKKKEKLGSTSKIRNERGEITTDITEIQRDHKRTSQESDYFLQGDWNYSFTNEC